MSIEWMAVESVSVLVENLTCLYFLNSRYNSKYKWYWPQLVTWGILVICGLLATVSSLDIYGVAAYGIMLVYLILFKDGSILQKIFGVLAVCTIEIGLSIVGAGIASVIESTTIEHTLENQDTSRMLAILFIKMMQVVGFYVLSKRQVVNHNLQRRPALVLCAAAIVDFTFLIMIRVHVELSDQQVQQNSLLVWFAIGALLVMVAIFMIYELFIREEIKNVELAMKLQRLELETSFFEEIDHIYSDMRTWQHEYKNNLSALRALVDHNETEKARDFIDNISSETYQKQIIIQTGNLVLDAIVSSKLWMAQSQNFEVNYQVVYPVNNCISDNDLCAIVGNLMDNAIEACARMGETTGKKFIDFSMTIKKKNLLLSVSNSYNNQLKQKGNRYFTVKKEPLHGIGILHIDSIVEKYQGHVVRTHEKGVFETHIMLPLLPPDE